jgi:superfamily I DNA/RNA helicase
MVKIPDKSQRKAIFAPPKQSILVTAPPGYGKTYVMPKRLAFLIKSGSLVPPERALGLTFTNAAASEMLTRVEKNIGSRYIDFIDAMTFHSFCYQVLRSHGDAIGLPIDFSIFPEGAKERLYEEKLKKNKISTETYSWYDYRDWENERVVRLSSTSDQTYPFWNFWRGYRQYQRSKAKVDFNHLLWFTY